MTTLSEVLPQPFSAAVFLSADASTRRISLQIARIAPHFRIALVSGEHGTGKLTVAHSMHRLSPAAAGTFTALDCTAFATSSTAHCTHTTSGTLYLQSLECVPLSRQAALLERLDSVSRHLRILLSNEADLRGLLASGRLLQPLYDRVAALAIRLTPLRERRDSLPLLASDILKHHNPSAWFNDQSLACLEEHLWPGNLDELWHFIAHQAANASGEVTPAHLNLPAPAPGPIPAIRLEQVIERHVIDVVQRCAGNKLRAAELLGISRSTLYRMLEAATHN